MAGTLAVTGAAELHAEFKAWLEKMDFEDVTVTDRKNDALNTVICDKKPQLVIIDSWFYRDGTPRRIGELLKLFPKLNIAVVSLHDFPLSNAPWFIWEGGSHTFTYGKDTGNSNAALRLCVRASRMSRQRCKA